MGGAAFLIRGELDYEKHAQPPQKSSFIKRLLWGKKPDGPKSLDLGHGKLIDVPARQLTEMSAAFQQYLQKRIPKPWPSTDIFYQYLKSRVVSVYVRGEQPVDSAPTDWYVQITFSGCAGMAEVSAELGAHWAEQWYQDEKEFITTSFLHPFHFTPVQQNPEDSSQGAFLPLGDLGYALYVGHLKDQQYPPEYSFELDAAPLESLRYEGEEYFGLMKRIDETFEPLMSDGRCRCQLCMPDFDHAAVERQLSSILNQS